METSKKEEITISGNKDQTKEVKTTVTTTTTTVTSTAPKEEEKEEKKEESTTQVEKEEKKEQPQQPQQQNPKKIIQKSQSQIQKKVPFHKKIKIRIISQPQMKLLN